MRTPQTGQKPNHHRQNSTKAGTELTNALSRKVREMISIAMIMFIALAIIGGIAVLFA